MSRTRLTALLVTVGLGAAWLAPAAAAPERAVVVRPAAPQALHTALNELLADPTPERRQAWTAAQRTLLADEAVVVASSEGTSEPTFVGEVGDVDGDRRPDLLVDRGQGFVVRSGRTGAALLSRPSGWLWGVSTGTVRAVWLDVAYEETDEGVALTMVVEALDAKARRVWTTSWTGTIRGRFLGPAYLFRSVDVPIVLGEQRDADGRPTLLLGLLSATETSATTTSSLQPLAVSVADGTSTSLPLVRGAGTGVAYATETTTVPGHRSCYAWTAPTGPWTRVGMVCDGTQLWATPVRLRDAYLAPAGDFDGDGASDLQVTTWGFERPTAREVMRGTRVLGLADGVELGTSRVDGLTAVQADVNGDGRPDFLEVVFDEGITVQGVDLAGEVLYRSSLSLSGSGSLGVFLGPDVTGDGARDAVLQAESQRGGSTTLVVDGRTGKGSRTAGTDDLLWPGLRRTGIDLLISTVEGRSLRTTVLSGAGGKRLLEVRVTGGTGQVRPGSAGSADVDGDGRRDLVVASRAGDRHLTTAFSATGRQLWQVSEKAPPPAKRIGFEVVAG